MGDRTDAVVFILTLQLDATSFERLQSLRQRYFPAALNFIPAHLTLLHTLSQDQVTRLAAAWPELGRRPPLQLEFARLLSLGRGVALGVEAAGLAEFRTALMDAIGGPFTRQDLARPRPHVTVQNKTDPKTARALLEELTSSFVAWVGAGEGVIVWRYLGGPWQFETMLAFGPP